MKICPHCGNGPMGDAYFRRVIITPADNPSNPIETYWCDPCAREAKESKKSWFQLGGSGKDYDSAQEWAKADAAKRTAEQARLREAAGEKQATQGNRAPRGSSSSGRKSGWQVLLDKNPDVATAKASYEKAKEKGQSEGYIKILARLLKIREEEAGKKQ